MPAAKQFALYLERGFGSNMREASKNGVSAMTAPDAAIEMLGVHKWYGSFHVLRNIDLTVSAASAS